jgi:hypothetical protein
MVSKFADFEGQDMFEDDSNRGTLWEDDLDLNEGISHLRGGAAPIMTGNFLELGLAQWSGTAALLIGLLSATLIYLRGRSVLERWRAPEKPKENAEEENSAEFDPFLSGSRDEKRVALRRRGCHIPVLISDSTGTAAAHEAWVVNRSPGGLGLLLQQPVNAGAVLSVRAANATAMIPWVQVQVRSCRQDESGYAVGCQFVKQPPSTVLWQFG